MREQSPAVIANRYFDLLIKFASEFREFGDEGRLLMRKRIYNLNRIVTRFADEGRIKLKDKKTLKEVFV